MEVATWKLPDYVSTSHELLPVANMAVDQAFFLTSRTRREEAREADVIGGPKRNEEMKYY